MRLGWWGLGFMGCEGFSASVVVPDTDAADTEVEIPDSEMPVDTAPPDPADVDDDGDGFTENEGDCDDHNGSISPDADDDCNGLDDNCNGEPDEGAQFDDPYELQGGEAFQLAALSEESEQQVSGTLYNTNDEDEFDFYLDDPFYDAFNLTITLDGIPTGADYQLTLSVIEPEEGSPSVIETTSGDGTLEILFEDSWNGTSQAGMYRVAISSDDGADCSSPYSLFIEKTWL